MPTTDATGKVTGVVALGLAPGMAVQELGWSDDVDELAISEKQVSGLADGLVDALTDLSPIGYIWLLSPKVGRDDYLDPTDLAEAALTAGLAVANPASVSANWQAQKLVRPKGTRR